MTQRNLAGLIAAPLLIGLWVVALTQPLPYVTYRPGLTLDVLGEESGQEIIQVSGHQTYRDAGQLRMTTVSVSQPKPHTVNLFDLMAAWISRDDAVYPYDTVYREDETAESNETEGQIEMVSSQDVAIKTALEELGYDVKAAVEVFKTEPGSPADGVLEPRDRILAVDGTRVRTPEDLVAAIEATPPGREVELTVMRDGDERTETVTPEEVDGKPRIGITPLPSYTFPFQVSVGVDPNIGGPSAGLMFSLGIYDTLTPGSLTGGAAIAGTGALDAKGNVQPIGGIQQKIAGARETEAKLFLVPPDNCDDALGARKGDLTLVKADTMHDAVTAIETWVADPDAPLPSCEKEDGS